MRIESINHVSINVKDFDASVAFYGGVLGLRRLQTVPMDGFSITYFEVPGGARLELFDYAGANKDVPRNESDAGLRHLAFSVDDVAAAFEDPNGVTLEVCQKL